MPRETPVRAVLTVVESLSDRHYRVALPNGKPIIAHLRKAAPEAWRHCGPGTRFIGELSPYDFEHARVAEWLPPEPAAGPATD